MLPQFVETVPKQAKLTADTCWLRTLLFAPSNRRLAPETISGGGGLLCEVGINRCAGQRQSIHMVCTWRSENGRVAKCGNFPVWKEFRNRKLFGLFREICGKSALCRLVVRLAHLTVFGCLAHDAICRSRLGLETRRRFRRYGQARIALNTSNQAWSAGDSVTEKNTEKNLETQFRTGLE